MFTTKVDIPSYPFRIDHTKKGLILGSCFAQEIGTKLLGAKMPITLNPNGIMFNPASIGRAYHDIINRIQYSESELVEHNGIWHSMQHHGSFSESTPEAILRRINGQKPTEFDYIIVTLGTAWVYQYGGEVVANCHKIPAEQFIRTRLSFAQCVESLTPIAQSLVPVIVTVSPVRHIKDGLAENSLSKSILRVAAGELSERYENVHYFPSFEILMDELRDYRYYGDDMLHPSTRAVEYIWERFGESFFTDQTQRLNTEIQKITTALAHRPIHPESAEHQQFRAKTRAAAEKLSAAHPEIDFSAELTSE